MPSYVVVGAGPVGRETARLLAAGDHRVTLVSRRGTPAGEGVRALALDAADGPALAALAKGADAILMCAMAPYHQWPSAFPPIMDGVVDAARATDARLVVLGNVYGYGSGAPSILTPATPMQPTSEKGRVRHAMWLRALAAGVRVLEVRASDYVGPGAASLFTLMTLPPLLAKEPAPWVGDPDVPHAWSYTGDVARTLVAALAYGGAWGRAFHVPSHHLTVRDLAARFAAAAGCAPARLHALSRAELEALALADPVLREVLEIRYLYTTAGTLDASETEALLGVVASPLDTMVRATLAPALSSST